jgi:hypothetical protein
VNKSTTARIAHTPKKTYAKAFGLVLVSVLVCLSAENDVEDFDDFEDVDDIELSVGPFAWRWRLWRWWRL